ncbi:MAG: hypothetical protein IKR34_02870, partial [Candidatus Gastranaerophilales bacterium]|nr:hypothetical protein [Candidatus Gastranaerophilales bacterium]
NQLAAATSGLRAPYMSEVFNPKTVKLLTLGVAEYAKNHNAYDKKPIIAIGGDTRVATRESLPQIEETLIKQGVDVVYMDAPVPTPLLALTANKLNLGISILMTASHNPWQDGGFNFITPEGAVAPSEITKEISENMDNIAKRGLYNEEILPTGRVYRMNPYDLYKKHIENIGLVDFDKISSSGIKVYYDGLNGTGNYVMPRLLSEYNIPFKEIVSYGQTGPNPTKENLSKLAKTVSEAKDNLKIGLANDGDADRFGIIDENGNFIDPNDVLLLVAYHLIHNKNLRGDIVRSQATSQQMDRVADKYNLKTHITPVGFKYIASDIMQTRKEGRDIIVAGEESGGLTTYGHIPEKDGILADFLILDLMAYENKPIGEILKKVKKELGSISYTDNYSKRLKSDEIKEAILNKVKERYDRAIMGDLDFGEMHKIDLQKTIDAMNNIKRYRPIGDGIKFVMTDDSTVLVRKSGTEPLLRFYIEALGKDEQSAKQGAQALKNYIEENFSQNSI